MFLKTAYAKANNGGSENRGWQARWRSSTSRRVGHRPLLLRRLLRRLQQGTQRCGEATVLGPSHEDVAARIGHEKLTRFLASIVVFLSGALAREFRQGACTWIGSCREGCAGVGPVTWWAPFWRLRESAASSLTCNIAAPPPTPAASVSVTTLVVPAQPLRPSSLRPFLRPHSPRPSSHSITQSP
jgi:hypothetical protein